MWASIMNSSSLLTSIWRRRALRGAEINAGSRALIFFTPGGGLIGALFCPAGDWKMATIAEIVLFGVGVGFWFFDVVVKWENVLFFAFHAVRLDFGVFWRYVEECDSGPSGIGFVGFLFLFLCYLIGVLYFSFLFYFRINYAIDL
ncbi:hypothetical protein [Paraburkholderia sp.]|uniref:hypothetical protein n=1 Tax=Paraburkholderia sp. TaxID=1926495 RepID=UPI002D3BA75A|nr:hypothetical protein [Paraburkholderia sp.]HZZ03660.1 hypothetical protein [Paraburkholderia sp.]